MRLILKYTELSQDFAQLQLSSWVHGLMDINQFLNPVDEVVEGDIETL